VERCSRRRLQTTTWTEAQCYGWTSPTNGASASSVDEASQSRRTRTTPCTRPTLDFNTERKPTCTARPAFRAGVRRPGEKHQCRPGRRSQIYDETTEAMITAQQVISIIVDYMSTHAGQNEACRKFFFASRSFARLASRLRLRTLYEVTLSKGDQARSQAIRAVA